MSSNNNYVPEVDDYVIWERECWNGTIRDEGWVYFKGEPIPDKKGFPSHVNYITIETGVKDKPKELLDCKSTLRHKKIHTLLLCYETQWHELRYVKKRVSPHIEHWSQYDERTGIEEHRTDKSVDMYKAQEHRYIDPQ